MNQNHLFKLELIKLYLTETRKIKKDLQRTVGLEKNLQKKIGEHRVILKLKNIKTTCLFVLLYGSKTLKKS